MATWITHLRVAEAVDPGLSGAELKYFLIGNLAPDAGMLNDDRKSYTPPAAVSHFRGKGPRSPWCESLVFYRRYFSAARERGDGLRSSFGMGYFTHLVLDNLWSYYVSRPARTSYEAEFSRDPMFIWKMKKDWYGIDREFLRERPQWPIWREFFGAEYRASYLDFYPREIIARKMDSIREFYSRLDEPERPGIYLDHETMDSFVVLAAYWIKRLVELIDTYGAGTHATERALLLEQYGAFRGPVGDLAGDCVRYIAPPADTGLSSGPSLS